MDPSRYAKAFGEGLGGTQRKAGVGTPEFLGANPLHSWSPWKSWSLMKEPRSLKQSLTTKSSSSEVVATQSQWILASKLRHAHKEYDARHASTVVS
ncbi:hypothetical protein E3N88_31956 [Mikania micrantha]|uniref:Uncharacterized protein n=1 Tax=Mikania micrantha TaxID=192012 RepID=A0A5N6M7M8_9ASTR|nr:hypothetical protein E3N88_31956 [Mikania micrantha]